MKDPVTELAEKILVAIYNSGNATLNLPAYNAEAAWDAAKALYEVREAKPLPKKPDTF